MKQFILSISFILVSLLVNAHPGIGIVKDSKGNIYYTDLEKVWKIATDGRRAVAVENVHTHELYIDKNDNLYGEHLWYNGEALDTWGHYAWCLKNSGELVKVVGPADGFLSNYSFVRDAKGNMYWVERFTQTRFMKKSMDGTIIKIAEAKLGDVKWIYSTSRGIIYFTADNKLQKLAGGKITVVVDIKSEGYGIWTDQADNIYVAILDTRKVHKLTPDGKSTTFLSVSSPWMPCSGLFDNNGNLWLLETSNSNEVRVRKIDKDNVSNNNLKAESQPFSYSNYVLIIILIVALVVGIWLFLRNVNKRSR